MQFEFKNLGTIKEAQLEMGNLTIICGKNNTGKTYLTYGVWGFIETWEEGLFFEDNKISNKLKSKDNIIEFDIRNLFKDFTYIYRESITNYFIKRIHKVFNVEEEFFSSTLLSLNYDNDFIEKVTEQKANFGVLGSSNLNKNEDSYNITLTRTNPIPANYDEIHTSNFIKSCIIAQFFIPFRTESFILPAQRDSIELFYKELDKNRSHLLEKLRETRDLSLLDKESSRFPQPIEKLIDFARDLTRQVIKTESFLAKEQPELLKEVENLLGVTYEVSGDEVLIKDKHSTQKVPAYMASTSVRSLMHLHFWLKHKAQKGDLLMIDEPELNLHPENQIKMARLFAKLVNAGIKVWITTHSDYIIKELNNCLMLSQEMENKKELLEELGYKENEILKRDDIRAYIARYDEKLEGCTVDKVEFDEYGMVMTTFDEQARNINAISDSLADAIDEYRIHKNN